jgi:Trypsin
MSFAPRRTAGRGVAQFVALAAVAALLPAAPALAISNGVPDGDRHPYVGLLTVEEDGKRYFVCSGFYAGEHRSAPGIGVFITAGHCVAWVPESDNNTPDQLRVTFDPTVTIDDAGAVTATNWHRATAIDFHPEFGHDHSNFKDYGVVLLAETVDVDPVELPTAGLLDRLAANGALRPQTLFDNVGYGLMASFGQGPSTYANPPGRMYSTSLFQGLTPAYLRLLMNSDAEEGNGGICIGDSGSPKLIHQTNTVVALATGGDAVCRAQNYSQRLDIADARAFLGQYLELP